MNYLEKYCVKKNLYLLDIAIGVFALIVFLTGQFIKPDSLGEVTSSLKFFVFLFWVYAIVKVAQVVASGFIFGVKKDSNKIVLVSLVMAAVGLLVVLMNINTIKFISAFASGDFGQMLEMASKAESADTMLGFYKFMLFADMAFGGFMGYQIFYKKNTDLDSMELTEEEKAKIKENADKAADKAVEMSKEGVSKAKAFLATPNGKKTAIIAVVALVIICIIWVVVSNKKTKIDVFNECQFTVTGVNGKGYGRISGCNVEYDKEDENQRRFMYSLSYEIENNGSISNGDKVKVTVKYDEEKAAEYKIAVSETTKEFEASGLTEYYEKIKDVPNAIVKSADKAIKEKANWDDNDFDIDEEFKITDKELLQKFYFTSKYNKNGTITYLYKVTATGQKRIAFSDEYEDVEEVIYETITVSPINSEYDENLANVNVKRIKVYDDKATDTDYIKQVIKNNSYNSDYEKFK